MPDSLPAAVAPPAPKPVVTPTPEAASAKVPDPTVPAAIEPKPRGRSADEPKPGEKGYEKFEDRIARRVNEAKAEEAKTAEQKAAEVTKAAADKAAAEKVTPTETDLSDEAFKTKVETETKQFKDPKEALSWSKLRYSERALTRQVKDMVPSTKLTELETQLAEARQQLEASKTAPAADPQEVATLKAQLDAAQKRDTARESELMIAKVERTEAFQNAVTKPTEKIEAQVAKIAKKLEVPADKLMKALTDTSDNQSDLLVEAATGMNEVDKMQYLSLVGKIEDINEKAAVLRANAKEALDKVSVKTQTELDAQSKTAREARQAAHTTTWGKLKAELADVLTPVEGEADDVKAWNKAQTDAEAFARDTDFNSLKPEVQSQVQARASVFPLLMGKLQSLEAEVKASRDETQAALTRLEKYEKTVPGMDANRQADADAADPAKGETDFVKRVDARMRAAGAH